MNWKTLPKKLLALDKRLTQHEQECPDHKSNVWTWNLQVTPLYRIFRCTYCIKVVEGAR